MVCEGTLTIAMYVYKAVEVFGWKSSMFELILSKVELEMQC